METIQAINAATGGSMNNITYAATKARALNKCKDWLILQWW
jgi:hypothetical protein